MTKWFYALTKPTGDVLPVRLGTTRRAATGSAPTRVMGFDQPLVWVTLTLLVWGLVMVYSASIALPENPRFANYTHTYFLIRHALWLVLALIAALLAFQVPIATWEQLARLLFVASVLLLAVVLIPYVGKVVYGCLL